MNKGNLVGIGETETIMTETNLEKTYGIGVKILSFKDEPGGKTIKYCMPCIKEECGAAVNK